MREPIFLKDRQLKRLWKERQTLLDQRYVHESAIYKITRDLQELQERINRIQRLRDDD